MTEHLPGGGMGEDLVQRAAEAMQKAARAALIATQAALLGLIALVAQMAGVG